MKSEGISLSCSDGSGTVSLLATVDSEKAAHSYSAPNLVGQYFNCQVVSAQKVGGSGNAVDGELFSMIPAR